MNMRIVKMASRYVVQGERYNGVWAPFYKYAHHADSWLDMSDRYPNEYVTLWGARRYRKKLEMEVIE